MSKPSVRPAQSSELPALVALINSAYRGDASRAGWTTEADLVDGQRTDADSLRADFERPDSVLLVAELAGRCVGCVFLERGHGGHTAQDEAYLGLLTIEPAAQSAGLGGALLTQAEAWAVRSWGVSAMCMHVIAQRSEILAWYERRGYLPTGQTEAFPYGDPHAGLPKRADLYFKILRKLL